MTRGALLVLAIAVWAAEGSAQEYGLSSIWLKQGEVIVVPYDDAEARDVRGRFFGRPVPVFLSGQPGKGQVLLGADLDDPPGPTELTLELRKEANEPRVVRIAVEVREAGFGTQAFTLPKRMVDLDAKTLARVNVEQARVASILAEIHPERLWRGPFLLPTEGEIRGSFGMRRLLNGQPRTPHGGEDIVAPRGTPVRAAQDGIVRLSEDHFFSGRSVILDHGLGLFTLYFHLNESLVREGASVRKGGSIGRVGATGRVTGPHLHWGALLGGARVNPLALLALPPE